MYHNDDVKYSDGIVLDGDGDGDNNKLCDGDGNNNEFGNGDSDDKKYGDDVIFSIDNDGNDNQ